MKCLNKDHPVVFSAMIAVVILFFSVMLSPIAVHKQGYWLDVYSSFSFSIIFGILSIGQFSAAKISLCNGKRIKAILHNCSGVILLVCIIILVMGGVLIIMEG